MNDVKYEIKVFYVQYDVSFLVAEILLDNVTSDEEAVRECERHRDTYYRILFEEQYDSMPDTSVKLLIVKRSDSDLPVTIGYTEIIKDIMQFLKKRHLNLGVTDFKNFTETIEISKSYESERTY